MSSSIRIAAALFFLMLPSLCFAQKVQLGLNAADLADMGTLSGEAGVAILRHWSVSAKAKLNPWTFNAGDPSSQFQRRQQTLWAGTRYWPWHVWSGWWASSGLQYSEYSRGGISSRETEEGDAYGATLSAGYTLMLDQHFNIEFGIGLWGGYRVYTVYACPLCGRVVDGGEKPFILPNEALLTLSYVF